METLMRYCYLMAILIVAGFAMADTLDLHSKTIETGQFLYLEHCAQCHGDDASGGSGPDIQGSIGNDVTEAITGYEAMPVIDLTHGQAEEIAVFLMSLAPDQARRRLGLD